MRNPTKPRGLRIRRPAGFKTRLRTPQTGATPAEPEPNLSFIGHQFVPRPFIAKRLR